MPELPEVETIKSDLCHQVVGKKITDVRFLWPGTLKNATPEKFSKAVIGQKITDVRRRAKNIDIALSNGYYLLFHMKMTGHLIYTDSGWETDKAGKWIRQGDKESPLYDPLNQFIRVIFWLDKDNILAFSDLRKFGYLKLMEKEELEKTYSQYGPEPLSSEFTYQYLGSILSEKNTAIKKILMDQKLIAGIGNIYADEILWDSCIHPLTPGKDITAEKIRALYDSILRILKRAVKLRGTSTSDFRDTAGKKGRFGEELKVYRRTGLPCGRDGSVVKRITVGGRGTHYCPNCQKLAEKERR